jgi:PAS domain S-box-containing protein
MSKAGILIIEDSFIVAYHLRTTLENEGYQVIYTCDSGEEAIRFIETKRPDLVLMDITLTGKMDGIQTAQTLKSRFNIPVIYITALTDKDTINRAKITEPYGYLTKPFEDREIFTVIEMALYKHDVESRLKQSEEKYFSTVNSISDAVVTIDRNYVITYMNPSAIDITQWTLEDAFGVPIMEVLRLKNEITEEIGINPIQCSVGTGVLNRLPENLLLVTKNGKELPIGESSLSPLMDKGDFTGLILVFKDMTEKRDHENLMLEMERHRMAALIEGQEKERARIAKDLHDGLGQMLNAIKLNTGLIISQTPAADHLAKLLDEAIQESVRISENLLPAKLRDFDLATCLKSFCSQIRDTTHSHVSFVDLGSRFKINQSQKVNLYRIAQEAVNNAIKHSEASSISVQLSEEQDYVRLCVEDDGHGIHPEYNSKRQNGLVNMRDRAEIMGGKLTIESDPHRGTVVIVEIPIYKLESHAKV